MGLIEVINSRDEVFMNIFKDIDRKLILAQAHSYVDIKNIHIEDARSIIKDTIMQIEASIEDRNNIVKE